MTAIPQKSLDTKRPVKRDGKCALHQGEIRRQLEE